MPNLTNRQTVAVLVHESLAVHRLIVKAKRDGLATPEGWQSAYRMPDMTTAVAALVRLGVLQHDGDLDPVWTDVGRALLERCELKVIRSGRPYAVVLHAQPGDTIPCDYGLSCQVYLEPDPRWRCSLCEGWYCARHMDRHICPGMTAAEQQERVEAEEAREGNREKDAWMMGTSRHAWDEEEW